MPKPAAPKYPVGVANVERPASIRIGRVAAELRMRRRRLDAYQRSPDWPGKEPARRWELSEYDHFLLEGASMLDVAVPDHDDLPLAAEVRAIVEDRLAQAGLDVWAPRVIRAGGCYRRRAGTGLVQACGWTMLTIQEMPNWSVHMPNSSPHICFSRGTAHGAAGGELLPVAAQLVAVVAAQADRDVVARGVLHPRGGVGHP